MANIKAVIFECSTEEYALPVDQVVSIEKLERVTPIPHLPNYLKGFTRIRGELVPVLDFQMILYNRPSAGDQVKMIVLHTDVINYGLVVTEAREILDLEEEILKQVGLVNYAKTKYFTAVANLENRIVTYVDPKVLVQSLEGIREIIEYLQQMKQQES